MPSQSQPTTAISAKVWGRRLRKVKELADYFGIAPGYRSSASEDLLDYINEEERYNFGRYCVVIEGDSDLFYLYPDYNNLADAKSEAVRDIGDGIYSETPVKIVDLDSGAEWTPRFDKIIWKKEA